MATISGSGSGMFAVCARGDEDRVAAAMVRGFESAGAQAWGSAASIVRHGARVERLASEDHSLK
jgi:homoserine kinase